MKSKMIRTTLIIILLHCGAQQGITQSTFLIDDFENPILPLSQGVVPITNALPGWTGYIGDSQVNWIGYNDLSLGAADISLQGPGSLVPVLDGSYSVLLQPSSAGPSTTAAIGRNLQIPLSMQSLLFDVSGNLQVTFNGQIVPLMQMGSGPNYAIGGGNISMFAGQTGELRFTTFGASWLTLDDIVFSSTPIPEPGTFGLFSLGVLFVGWRLFRGR